MFLFLYDCQRIRDVHFLWWQRPINGRSVCCVVTNSILSLSKHCSIMVGTMKFVILLMSLVMFPILLESDMHIIIFVGVVDFIRAVQFPYSITKATILMFFCFFNKA